MAIVKRGSCSKLSTLQVVKCEFICESCKHEEKLTVENSREDHIVCSKCKGKMSVIETTVSTTIIDDKKKVKNV